MRLVVAITIFGEGVFPDQGSMACSQSARKLKSSPQENNYCVKGKNDYDVLKQLQNASEVFLLDFYI